MFKTQAHVNLGCHAFRLNIYTTVDFHPLVVFHTANCSGLLFRLFLISFTSFTEFHIGKRTQQFYLVMSKVSIVELAAAGSQTTKSTTFDGDDQIQVSRKTTYELTEIEAKP